MPDDNNNSTNPDGQEEYPDLVKALLDLGPGEARMRTWLAGISPHVTFVSSTPHTKDQNATVTFRFNVRPEHTNGFGNLHGGCNSTLFDFCTSAVLGMVNSPGFWFWLGVSRQLNVTYLKPVPVGESVLIESELVHVGKRMAHIKGKMRSERDGVLLCTCEHDKVNTDTNML